MSVVRIQNVPLDPHKHLRVALRALYGIGETSALQICAKSALPTDMKVKDLTADQLRKLQEAVEAYETEGDLKRKVAMRIKRLKDIGCYRGKRHKAKLPARGQRTRTNARTNRGGRKSQQVAKSVKSKVAK